MWTYFTDMFDFLTLSVVIDDRIFCVHGGQLCPLIFWTDLYFWNFAGLSPSIHSIDQIKVVDRFRGMFNPRNSYHLLMKQFAQKFPTKVRWQTWYGRIRIQKKKILQYLPGKSLWTTHTSSFSDYSIVAQATHSAPVSCTNFSKRIACYISSVHINCAWKGTLLSSKSISRQYGRHRIIAIGAGTPPVY